MAECMCNVCVSCHCFRIPTSQTILSISGIPLRMCGLFSTLSWQPGSGNSQCRAPLSPRETGQGPSSTRDGRREEADSQRKASGPSLTQQQPWRWSPPELLGFRIQLVLLLLQPRTLRGSRAATALSLQPKPREVPSELASYGRRRGLELVKRRGRDGLSSPLAAGGRRRPALPPSPGGAAPGAATVLRTCECPRGPRPRGPRASYGWLPRAAVYVRFLSLCAERQKDYENDSLSELQYQITQPGDEMHHSTAGRLRGLLSYPGAVAPRGWGGGEAAGRAVFFMVQE